MAAVDLIIRRTNYQCQAVCRAHFLSILFQRFAFELESSDELDDCVQLLNGYSRLLLGVALRVLVIDEEAKDDNKSPGGTYNTQSRVHALCAAPCFPSISGPGLAWPAGPVIICVLSLSLSDGARRAP